MEGRTKVRTGLGARDFSQLETNVYEHENDVRLRCGSNNAEVESKEEEQLHFRDNGRTRGLYPLFLNLNLQ